MRDHDHTVIGVTPSRLRRAGVKLHGRTRETAAHVTRFDDGLAVTTTLGPLRIGHEGRSPTSDTSQSAAGHGLDGEIQR